VDKFFLLANMLHLKTLIEKYAGVFDWLPRFEAGTAAR